MTWDSLVAVATGVGPSGLLLFVIASIVKGWLIPRSTHLERVADLRQRAEDYKAAWEAEKQVTAEGRQQIAILLGARAKEPMS